MKKILIVGAGVEQIAAIQVAKEMGLYVIVSDYNPQAPGVVFADEFYEVSTTDVEGNRKVAEANQVDGVLTICSETAVPTVAGVAESLNLPSFSKQTALLATNKREMRRALSQADVQFSPYCIAQKIEDVYQFTSTNNGPWVLKPVDSSGQRGTSVIREKEDVEAAFYRAKDASVTGEVLLDQLIEGNEVHVTMQVVDGEATFLALSDRVTLDKDNFGIAVRHIGPSELDKVLEDGIKKMSRDSVKAIGLQNGVCTCEIIVKEGELYLMEIAVRVPGGYLREVALYLSGVDIVKATILSALGINKPIDELSENPVHGSVSAKFITNLNIDKSVQTIETLDFNSDYVVPSSIKVFNKHFKGAYDVPPLNSSVGRFAVLLAVGETREEAIAETEKAFNALLCNNQYPLQDYSSYNPFNAKF